MGIFDFLPSLGKKDKQQQPSPQAFGTKNAVAEPQINVPAANANAVASLRTYTVKAGDTLSKIARLELGDASKYGVIFKANRDILTDPDKIYPGQVLKIPGASKHLDA